MLLADMRVGVGCLNDCLNASGEATGFGSPLTPCACRQSAYLFMSWLACAIDIAYPFRVVVLDALGLVGPDEAEPHAAIAVAVARINAARARTEVVVCMSQLVARRWLRQCNRATCGRSVAPLRRSGRVMAL